MTFLRQSVVLILAWSVLLSGCTSWRTHAEDSELTRADEIQIVLKSGTVMEVKEPHVENGTLFGKGKRTVVERLRYETDYWDLPVAVSLGDIREIKTKQVSTGKTVLVIVGTEVVLGAIAGGVALASWDPSFLGNAGN